MISEPRRRILYFCYYYYFYYFYYYFYYYYYYNFNCYQDASRTEWCLHGWPPFNAHAIIVSSFYPRFQGVYMMTGDW